MRLTIIPSDNFVSIDGVGFHDIDLSFINTNVHAIQWYGDNGVIEIKDNPYGRIISNENIYDITQFQQAIDSWNNAKTIYEQQLVVKAAEEARIAEQVKAAELLRSSTQDESSLNTN